MRNNSTNKEKGLMILEYKKTYKVLEAKNKIFLMKFITEIFVLQYQLEQIEKRKECSELGLTHLIVVLTRVKT